ncbi:MAG TPA: galactokinase family protein, partial [Acidimicrobiales bacterium]|nr:galactokinase family protein [Acidimicrobiales bacterium]
ARRVRSDIPPMTGTSADPTMPVRAFAPGRVNLIGDHTDYTGGWCLPIALPWGTTVEGTRGGDRIRITSGLDDTATDLARLGNEVDRVDGWQRYVAAVAAQVRPAHGFTGRITTTLPIGAGLSSSAALEVALALALGFDGPPDELAKAAQRAEHAAVGVPCGIMDQLTSVFGIRGHALLIDCESLEVLGVPIPDGADICIIDPGQSRTLAGSAYADRRAVCAAAEQRIGPLRQATVEVVATLEDPILRRRAHHVVTENRRVLTAAKALRRGDWAAVGAAMVASHRSLRDDFEVSTPVLDDIVAALIDTDGVHGARLTGAGFGGCVVAICEPGALPFAATVTASRGARLDGLMPGGPELSPGADAPSAPGTPPR